MNAIWAPSKRVVSLLLFRTRMKTISYTVVKEGRGYVNTLIVPENHSEAATGGAWGMVIAAGLLVVTATFVCLVLLS